MVDNNVKEQLWNSANNWTQHQKLYHSSKINCYIWLNMHVIPFFAFCFPSVIYIHYTSGYQLSFNGLTQNDNGLLTHLRTRMILIPWICYERSYSEFYLYMKPISFQSKASVICSVTAATFIYFCLKELNVFSQHIGKKTKEYLNSTEQILRNWNVDQLSMLITS